MDEKLITLLAGALSNPSINLKNCDDMKKKLNTVIKFYEEKNAEITEKNKPTNHKVEMI